MKRKKSTTPNWVYINAIDKDPRPKAAHKALLHAIRSFRNNDTGECYPAISSIAERAGMSIRSVHGLLAELKEWDFVKWRAHPNGSNAYTLYPTPAKFAYKQYSDERPATGRIVPHFDGKLVDKAHLLDHTEWSRNIDRVQAESSAQNTGYTQQQLESGFNSGPGYLEGIPF
ncbi:protein of unknown function [Pseudodesulfovibrio profundus]|uniref:Helix-turn-helix domain-containing protein n=1 Tax=Pseudodesulfovibrio profundus TaxID=57320 RepID=A0A2C8FFG6_9BACT|nr:helix-turn-helix domain-containing protein [Pseudodesulfovibrio profundus]SOB60628.1 protein of unknown function [Pseudodesulfovibrio profundus]